MISLISKWWIQQGNESIVIPALKKLAKDVEENEKNTLTYMVHVPEFGTPDPSVPVPRPGEVIFVETYLDWAAFQNHVNGPIFTTFKKKYGDLFVQANSKNSYEANPYVYVEFLTRIAGFDNSF